MVLFLGFDIGDAESIIAFAKGNSSNVTMATMPGKNAAGMAIPTLYGYTDGGTLQLADSVAMNGYGLKQVAVNFKRCPSDIIVADENRKFEMMAMDDELLWQQPELCSGKIAEYTDKLNTFISIIFNDAGFQNLLEAQLDGCDECRVAVGHPTRWTSFDVFMYNAMLRRGLLGSKTLTVLGRDYKLRLAVEAESRAAFLYIRDAYKLNRNDRKYICVVDVGSSTIDISVMKDGDARNFVYNDGHTFLGARAIDYLIMEYCVETLRKGSDADLFNDIFAVDAQGRQKNPAAWEHMLINCRFAKEALFASNEQDKSRLRKPILILDFIVPLTYNTLVNDICNRPVAGVLKKYCDLSDEDYAVLGNKNWKELYRQFMIGQKKSMYAQGIEPSQIFFTGSASRMSFVKEICREVFFEIADTRGLLEDTNPSNAIANGLARVGVSDYEASEFEQEIEDFLKKPQGLRSLVQRRIPDLIAAVAGPTMNVIRDKVLLARFREWQEGKHRTVMDMLNSVEATLKDEKAFNELLQSDDAYRNAAKTWIVDMLGNDISTQLLSIATKYHVTEFSKQSLNAFRIDVAPNVKGSNEIDLSKTVGMEPISAVLSAIVGFVTYSITPFIVGIIIGMIWLVSESVGISIILALLECPEPIITTALAVIALIVAGLTKKAFRDNKEKINKVLSELDLPIWVRKKVKEEEILKSFNTEKAELIEQMNQQFRKQAGLNEIVDKISKTIQPQVEKKTDDIKYVIQSR